MNFIGGFNKVADAPDDRTWETFKGIERLNKEIKKGLAEAIVQLESGKHKYSSNSEHIIEEIDGAGDLSYNTVHIDADGSDCDRCSSAASTDEPLENYTHKASNMVATDSKGRKEQLDEPAPLYIRTHPGCKHDIIVFNDGEYREVFDDIVFDFSGKNIGTGDAKAIVDALIEKINSGEKAPVVPDEQQEGIEEGDGSEEGDGAEEGEENNGEPEEEIPGISQDFEDFKSTPSIADVGKKTREILNKKVKSWLIGKL